jgi:hypothetical protein
MVLDFVDVYQYYSPQNNSLQISTHNLSFEVYLHFKNILWRILFWHKHTLYV